MIYRFDNFQIDAARRILQRGGEPLALNPKAFDLLLTLIENRGEILSKNDLLERVWENQFVEENNLTVHISALRKALGEKKNENRFLVTIPGKGYKFVGALNEPSNEIIIENHSFSRIVIDEDIGEIIGKKVKSAERKFSYLYLLPLTFLLVIGGVYVWRQAALTNNSRSVSFVQPNIKQLTTNGKVAIAALAPDGETFAYVVNDSGQRSLRIGFVDGGNHLQLRPAAEDARYSTLTFAPDGNRLYFSFKDDKNPKFALYRMPVSGGVQEKVLDDIDVFSLSPDGRQIAFGRREGEKDSLFAADLNGANEREIASFPKNEAVIFNTLSWSPDNQRLAFSKLKDAKSLGNNLAIVEISSGKVQLIENEIWRDTAKTVWLRDGSGVIVHAVKHDSWTSVPQYHLFQVEIPSGKAREINNDLSSYDSSLDLSAKSDALLTIVHQQLNNIWIAPADNLGAAKQITFGSFGKYDGLWGMDFTPDGKIIYTNSDTQSQFISEMNADGSNSKPLTAPGIIDSVLNVSNDGRYIVFHSIRSGGDFDIWRTDIDGTNPKQLTFGDKNYQPFVSADNRWVYYKSWEKDIGELRRVPIDGGEPEILNDKETSWVSFSPDGRYFAAAYKTDKSRLAVFDAATNQIIKQFDLAKNGTMSIGSRWSPDSRAVAYRDWNDGYWLQAVEGGEPQKMEGLAKEKFYNFAWSKDGKQFAFVRGQELRDVVLLQATNK